ncbi:unnamed protein product [Calypogeia fissa]
MGRSKGDASRSSKSRASSSLAASLLQTPVTAAVGFGGFVGSDRVEMPAPTDGERLQDVDGDAFLHLKRLSKKDPTTKLKALVALRALFEERPATEVSALISPWLFEYKRLVQDSSRQVRQATHVAMTSFANCVGRGLAPHLKSLMGPWWISQFDPSREVSEAAKDSFQVAFSGQKKRLEALMFCEKEIFNHLDENLKLTPQTVADKATPIEESTEKYERVVSCSLLASAALIDVLVGSISGRTGQGNAANSVDLEEISNRKARIGEDVRKLCGNHRFLQQFLKSKASRVRSATYQALRSYIQHLPEVFREEDMDIVVPSILGAFAEKDPACHQHMWDMVLLFTKAFPQSWGTTAVKKAVFPQLWSFLRHGCYGSAQTSYPYVVLLISLMPPRAVIPSQTFLLNLFSNLWQGQTAPQFGLADFTALLKAVQECLIWSVLNAKRFSDAEGYEAVELQVALIDGVLVKLLWHGYIGGNLSQDAALVSSVVDFSPSTDLSGPTPVNKASGVNLMEGSSNRFKQELGSCIVQTIHLLSGHVDEIMDTFWNEFQGSCFQIVLDAGNCWQSKKEEDPRISRIADFFLVLCSKTSKGEDREQWSLTHTVRPFVEKSFPAIRSLGHPGSIRLIAKLTSTYGPSVFSLLSVSQVQTDKTGEGRQLQHPVDNEDLREFFKKDIVPWCLAGDDDLNGPKAELILAFIESNKFQSEWEVVISHVTEWLQDTDCTVDFRQAEVLATLLEKVIERKNALSTSKDYLHKGNDMKADCWRSSRIDRAAVKVASSSDLFHPSCLRLLRSALGGTSSEQPLSPIVSDEAAVDILNFILSRMLRVLSAQGTKWTRSAPLLIMNLGAGDLNNLSEDEKITEKDLQLAVSAVNILGECIFSLLALDRDHTISGKLLAAIFCLKWAYPSPDDVFYNDFDSTKDSGTELDDSEEEIDSDANSTWESFNLAPDMEDSNILSGTLEVEPSSKLEQGWSSLRESLLSIWQKATPQFLIRFSALTRFGLRQVLMKCIRVAVLDEESETPQPVARRCAGWAQEAINYVCSSQEEVSEFVDLLLASADSWPLWVVAPSPKSNLSGRYLPSRNVQQNVSGLKIQRHGRFVAFVDHLSRTLTVHDMFLGSQRGTEMIKEDNLPEKLAREPRLSGESCRTWVVVELLCTWEWPGGNALSQVLPYLWYIARSPEGSSEYSLLWGTIQGLFVGSSNSSGSNLDTSLSSGAAEDDGAGQKEPFLRALLVLLQGLLEKEDGWSIFDARSLFRLYITKHEAADFVSPICDVQILPRVLAVMMPILRKRGLESADTSSEEEWQSFLQTAVSLWVQKALTGPPLVAFETDPKISGYQWVKIAVACFPLNPAGGAAAMASASSVSVTSQERELLLALLRKQYSYEAIRAVAALAAAERISQVKLSDKMEKNKGVEVTLAKLVAVALGYCWLNFGTEEWEFILKKVRGWLQEAVIEAEEFTEAVVDIVKEAPEMPEVEVAADSVMSALENMVAERRDSSVQLYSVAVAIFSLLRGLSNLEKADSTDATAKLKDANWETVEIRILEDVLRLLLSIGLAESGAATSNAGENGAKLIASQRQLHGQLWDSVADVALGASNHARQAAIRAVDLWGVGKGAIGSLYALLFSPKPTTSLQWVAYEFLSTPEILPLAISFGIVVGSGETKSTSEEGSIVEGEVQVQDEGEVKVEDVKGEDAQGMFPGQVAQIRPELVSILEIRPSVILRSPLTSPLRVSYLLGWSLLLTRLQSLTALSRTRELLVQYVQDSDISPTLLDCLFQYIPHEQKTATSGSKRRNRTAKVTTSSAAASATRAAATGSVAFAVEGVWPVQKESLVTLAGAIYGLMLLVLPACVRTWFTGLRDKSLASAIEAFTSTHCSPQLLADEFAQVQASAVNEENLSIRSNRTLREVTAIYQKEEAGMDIVIRIPSCYPLRAVEVECTRRLGINETLLRKWILSMAAFLRNQNGAVAEAVQMWKKNVDREFEGVEECPICYSIIHTSNHSLPRLACKTCRHKFHSACLYKWFSTSHQSTCPLCKSPF